MYDLDYLKRRFCPVCNDTGNWWGIGAGKRSVARERRNESATKIAKGIEVGEAGAQDGEGW